MTNSNYEVSSVNGVTTISRGFADINGKVIIKSLSLATAVYECFQGFGDGVTNSEAQVRLALALGEAAPKGRNSKAAGLLERYTPGYKAFNGWCALATGFVQAEGRNKRCFATNPAFEPVQAAAMLTRQPKVLAAPAPEAVQGQVPELSDISLSDIG